MLRKRIFPADPEHQGISQMVYSAQPLARPDETSLNKPPLTPIVVAPRSWSSWSSGYEARAKKRSRLGWLCAVSNSQPTNPHTRNLLKGPPTRQSLYKPRSVTGGQQDANSRGFGTCQQKTKTATAPGSCYLDRQCRYEEGSQANQQHLAEPEKFLKAGSSEPQQPLSPSSPQANAAIKQNEAEPGDKKDAEMEEASNNQGDKAGATLPNPLVGSRSDLRRLERSLRPAGSTINLGVLIQGDGGSEEEILKNILDGFFSPKFLGRLVNKLRRHDHDQKQCCLFGFPRVYTAIHVSFLTKAAEKGLRTKKTYQELLTRVLRATKN